MKKLFRLVILSVLLTSCGTAVRTLETTGGSKADAIVELSFEFATSFKKNQIDWDDAQAKANVL
jgi:hypothetical protein